MHSCVAIVICLVRFILKTSNTNRGHCKKECTPLLKHAVSEIMLTKYVHKRTLKRIKFDNRDDLTPFECISECLSENHIVFKQNILYFHFFYEMPTA